MKFLKLSFVAASAAMVIGSGIVARATIPVVLNVANGYYVFTSTSDTALNGSWVEFTGDSIIEWDLVDSTNLSYFPVNSYPPLTSSNSDVTSLSTASGNEFSFTITDDSVPYTGSSYFDFLGDNDWSGYTVLDDTSGDPMGTWTFDLTQPGLDPVPESSSTFELLAGALIAVATVASRKRNRAAIGA